jgi:histidine kinase/DNA gyrase B/HSP90-like ATPase
LPARQNAFPIWIVYPPARRLNPAQMTFVEKWPRLFVWDGDWPSRRSPASCVWGTCRPTVRYHPGRVVHDVVKRLDRVEASRARIEISSESLDAHGEVDAELIERVVENVLANAFKCSPSDVPIQISIQGDRDGLRVCVRDHGIGLARDEMSALSTATVAPGQQPSKA